MSSPPTNSTTSVTSSAAGSASRWTPVRRRHRHPMCVAGPAVGRSRGRCSDAIVMRRPDTPVPRRRLVSGTHGAGHVAVPDVGGLRTGPVQAADGCGQGGAVPRLCSGPVPKRQANTPAISRERSNRASAPRVRWWRAYGSARGTWSPQVVADVDVRVAGGDMRAVDEVVPAGGPGHVRVDVPANILDGIGRPRSHGADPVGDEHGLV